MQAIEIKKLFKEGKITKSEFIDMMHEKHKNIFEYSQMLEGTDIKSVTIEKDKIVMETKREGIKMLCDFNDKRMIPIEIVNFGEYEKDELELLKKCLKKDSIVFDIGANIGYYSIVLSKYINNGKVYSFEPIPPTYDYLCKHIEINDAKNIITNNIALSNYNGKAQFFYYDEGMVNSSMKILNKDVENKTVDCVVQTIDSFVEEKNIDIDLIKCDTEGSEYLVFKGAKETLMRCKPIIFTEMLRKWSKAFDYHPNEMINYLRELGYTCFTFGEGKLKEFEEMDEETIDTNFVFLDKKKHADVLTKLC